MKGIWTRMQHDRPIRIRRYYRLVLSAAPANPPPSNPTPTIIAARFVYYSLIVGFPPRALSSLATTRDGSCPARAFRAAPARADLYSTTPPHTQHAQPTDKWRGVRTSDPIRANRRRCKSCKSLQPPIPSTNSSSAQTCEGGDPPQWNRR